MEPWAWFVGRLKGFYQWKAGRRAEGIRRVQVASGLTLERAVRLRVFQLDASRFDSAIPIDQSFVDLSFRFADGRAVELPADAPYDTWPATDAPTLMRLWRGTDDRGRPFTAQDALRTGHLVDMDPSKPVRLRDLLQIDQALPELRRLFGTAAGAG